MSNEYARLRPHRGAALKDGFAYHDVPGLSGCVHRKGTMARVAQITAEVDVTGAKVLDLGCSVGGVSIALAQAGATWVLGVDWDETAVEFGNDTADLMGAPVALLCRDLADEQTWSEVLSLEWDVVVWLANWMWVANAAGAEFAEQRIADLAATGATLVFETAEAGGSMAGNFGIQTATDVADLLYRNGYNDITHLGDAADGWHHRHVVVGRVVSADE